MVLPSSSTTSTSVGSAPEMGAPSGPSFSARGNTNMQRLMLLTRRQQLFHPALASHVLPNMYTTPGLEKLSSLASIQYMSVRSALELGPAVAEAAGTWALFARGMVYAPGLCPVSVAAARGGGWGTAVVGRGGCAVGAAGGWCLGCCATVALGGASAVKAGAVDCCACGSSVNTMSSKSMLGAASSSSSSLYVSATSSSSSDASSSGNTSSAGSGASTTAALL
mmetsp:Transcript_89711/g.149155  ORF Transcript_89711/g.149155 Transcript_89711/m.149155 type:complete len:223 (+) Transcript_89711:4146-4814(+)